MLEESIEALDGHRLIIRPLPHVAILRDELTQLFDDEYDEEEEEAEARGEHTLSEKFSKRFAAAQGDKRLPSVVFLAWILHPCNHQTSSSSNLS